MAQQIPRAQSKASRVFFLPPVCAGPFEPPAEEQLDAAYGDDHTVLADGLTRPAHWFKAKGGQPAPQPDDGGRAPAANGAPGPGK
jgi:hypothetical protein